MSKSIDLALHGWFYRDTHFICPSELEANYLLKLTAMQTLNNLISIFLVNPNILFFHRICSLNIYEYLKYQQHSIIIN